MRWNQLSLRTQVTLLILVGALLVEVVSTTADLLRAQTWRHDELVNRGTMFLNEGLAWASHRQDLSDLDRELASSERSARVDGENAALQIGESGGVTYPGLAKEILAHLRSESFPVRSLSVSTEIFTIDPDYRGVFADFLKLRGIDDAAFFKNAPSVSARAGIYSLQLEGRPEWLNFYILLAPENAIRPLVFARLGDAAITMGFAFLVAFLIGRVMRPVRRVAESAERLGRGEDVGEQSLQGSLTVRQLIVAFNRMAARLKLSLDYQTALLRSLGHDTKGPVGEIRKAAEDFPDPAGRDRLLRWVTRLEMLTASVSDFSRKTRRDGSTERIDLTMLVETLADEEADAGNPVSFLSGEPAIIIGRHNAIIRVFQNLISNALKYGGCARLRVFVDGEYATVFVDDDGPGIDVSKTEAAFAPFERMGASGPGSGLGLAIVRTIAVDHGGSVALENRSEGGLRAIVRLPLEPSSAA